METRYPSYGREGGSYPSYGGGGGVIQVMGGAWEVGSPVGPRGSAKRIFGPHSDPRGWRWWGGGGGGRQNGCSEPGDCTTAVRTSSDPGVARCHFL